MVNFKIEDIQINKALPLFQGEGWVGWGKVTNLRVEQVFPKA
jgi:hypothetical protein